MTSDDAPPTRRARREAEESDPIRLAPPAQRPEDDAPDAPRSPSEEHSDETKGDRTLTEAELRVVAYPYVPVDITTPPRPPRRRVLRPAVVVPVSAALVAILAYVLATLLWPLPALAPDLSSATTSGVAAPASAPAWPGVGTAAATVEGQPDVVASGDAVDAIASITKLVTALMVLDRMPLAPGESGPSVPMTGAEHDAYVAAVANGESALDVPVGGALTQAQLLQGLLIGSANNYARTLRGLLWESDAAFAADAEAWLAAEGLDGIRITDPTGLDAGNRATAAALLPLAERALADPTVAGIVATREVELPGAGLVRNSNALLADPGVVGLKTGTLDGYNLLAAKDVEVGGETVRIVVATLGQPDGAARLAATRAVFDSIQTELAPARVIADDTVVGTIETPWDDRIDVLAAADVDVSLWNGDTAAVTTSFALGEARTAGQGVGTLTAAGSFGTATAPLVLASDLTAPDAWWRLTHPLQVFGLLR